MLLDQGLRQECVELVLRRYDSLSPNAVIAYADLLANYILTGEKK